MLFVRQWTRLFKIIVFFSSLFFWANQANSSEQKSVAILSIVEHPALDAIRQGIQDGLAQTGFIAEKNLKWRYQSAQGNSGTAAQIARQFIGEQPDVIVAIATPAAQAVVSATKTIPVVYAGITDPIAAQLVKSFDASGTNVTGVSDMLMLEKQIDLIKQILPHAKRVGIVYSPGEANSIAVVKELRVMLPKVGLELIEAAAARTMDVSSAARSLIGKVDLFYTSTDNNVVSAYDALVKVGQAAHLPLIAVDPDSVKRGALAALGIQYHNLGVQTGKMVARILKGEKPGDIASEKGNTIELFLNAKVAKQLNISFPDDLLQSATHVIH